MTKTNEFERAIDDYLERVVQQRNTVIGYKVVCDMTNNTEESIKAGEMWVSTCVTRHLSYNEVS